MMSVHDDRAETTIVSFFQTRGSFASRLLISLLLLNTQLECARFVTFVTSVNISMFCSTMRFTRFTRNFHIFRIKKLMLRDILASF